MKTKLRIDTFQPIAASQDDEALVAGFTALERPPPAGPGRPPTPDATLMLARLGDRPVARLTYRTARGLKDAPDPVGLIGHYEADDGEAGTTLLEQATAALAEEGAKRVVGPMDSTTWGRYRLALPGTGAGEDPAPFLTEPINPPDYPAHFQAAGLEPVEHYLSRLVPELDALADRTSEVRDQMAAAGYALSPLEPARFDTLLDELYDLSVAAFAENPYYSSITRAAFRETYAPVRSFLDPELVVLARDAESRLAGFVFAFPDLMDPAGEPTRIVVKTLAVATTARGAGIGSLLVHEVHRRAAGKGFRAAIHALMHVENASVRISEHGGDVFRRYALFGRDC